MIKLYLFKTCLLVFLTLATFVARSQARVTGVVTSSDDGIVLPGVSILEKGTTNGTVTSSDGRYSITVADDATLVFSFVGFATQELPVGGRSTLDVVLA